MKIKTKNPRAHLRERLYAYIQDASAKSAMKMVTGLLLTNTATRFPVQIWFYVNLAGLTLMLVGLFEIFDRRPQ